MNIGFLLPSLMALGRMGRNQMWRPMAPPVTPPPSGQVTWELQLQQKLPRDWTVKKYTCYHSNIYAKGQLIAECDRAKRVWRTINPRVCEFLVSIGDKAYLDVPDAGYSGLSDVDYPPFPFKPTRDQEPS